MLARSSTAVTGPERRWVQGDVADKWSLVLALAGCDAAFYLVHGLSEGHDDFRRQEIEAAERFGRQAAAAGVRRLVYLGGFQPQGELTEHLRSRLEVGETLRSGPVTAVELRASMIVGHGSTSWLMVRDLAARLPVMVLPSWLRSRTQPVALDDVLFALVAALDLELAGSESFDIPGPEVLTGREILERTAEALAVPRAVMVEVPVLSPWLSSHWVHFVTRAEWSVAREVVIGLAHDFLARDDRFWSRCGHTQLIPFREAAERALAAERADGPIPGFWGSVEAWMSRRSRRRAAA
jgi:uncharacterized protein YbjT (DUF2867 family)